MNGFGKSITGRIRTANEDSILVRNGAVGSLSNLYIVADGMGGHLAGEIASSMAINETARFLEENKEYTNALDAISDAVMFANNKIYDNGTNDSSRHGMGTTILAASVTEDTAYIVNVGDSRLYAVNPGAEKIEQITVDHSYVQELLALGRITADEAEHHPNKNIITRALGSSPYVECDRFIYKTVEGDILLMCSDGLTNMLSNNDILSICKESKTIEETVSKLIDGANEKGGVDNISVIVLWS